MTWEDPCLLVSNALVVNYNQKTRNVEISVEIYHSHSLNGTSLFHVNENSPYSTFWGINSTQIQNISLCISCLEA